MALPAAAAGSPTLRRPLSTRAAALSEAYAAVPGGLSSLGTNPAGLAAARRPELETIFTSGILDDAFGFLAFSQPLTLGTAAAGLSYYDAGKVDLRFTGGVTETRTAARDFVGHAAWALPLPGGLALGAAGKYYRFELAQEARASGAAADLGAQWKMFKGFIFGGAVQNLGPNVKFEVDSDPLPRTWRGGASWSWVNASVDTKTRFLASAEAIVIHDEPVVGALGAEIAMDFGLATSVALRGGGRMNSDADRLTFGLGVREGRFTLDYALGDKRSELGPVHHIGFGVRF